MAWPAKNPDDDVNPDPTISLRKTDAPAELSSRDWKLMRPPVLMTLAILPAWLAAIYAATYLGGIDPLALEPPIFFIFMSLWLAQFDAYRIKGAAARTDRRVPPLSAAAYGSAPLGLLVGAQLATVFVGAGLAAAVSHDDSRQLAVVAGGILSAFAVSWLLELWLGRADRNEAQSVPASAPHGGADAVP